MLRSTVKVGVTENVQKIKLKKTSLVYGEDFHLTFYYREQLKEMLLKRFMSYHK